MSEAPALAANIARSTSYQAARSAELVSCVLGTFAKPPTFSAGKKEDVIESLESLRAAFTLHGDKKIDEATRMAVALQLLRGRATSVVSDWPKRCTSRFDIFAVRMEDSFDYRNPHKVIDAIVQTRPGTSTLSESLRGFEVAGLNEILRLKLFEDNV